MPIFKVHCFPLGWQRDNGTHSSNPSLETDSLVVVQGCCIVLGLRFVAITLHYRPPHGMSWRGLHRYDVVGEDVTLTDLDGCVNKD